LNDLEEILDSYSQKDNLPSNKMLEVSELVKKLQKEGVSDDDIIIEIEQIFNQHSSNLISEEALTKINNQTTTKCNNVLRDDLYNQELSSLRTKIIFNWIELLGVLIISPVLINTIINLSLKVNLLYQIGISIATGFIITVVVFYFRRYQLRITKEDQTNLFIKISNQLNNS